MFNPRGGTALQYLKRKMSSIFTTLCTRVLLSASVSTQHAISIVKKQGVERGSNEKNLAHQTKQSPGINSLTGTLRYVAAPIALGVLMFTFRPVLSALKIHLNVSSGSAFPVQQKFQQARRSASRKDHEPAVRGWYRVSA
jgi:hypothetical protein